MELEPERPLECGECKKPVVVIYTEIVGKMIYRIAMCADCPVLRQKLYGTAEAVARGPEALAGGLCCGSCGTTADEIKMGSALGCSICYEVFDNLLSQELLSQERIPPVQ